MIFKFQTVVTSNNGRPVQRLYIYVLANIDEFLKLAKVTRICILIFEEKKQYIYSSEI